jgi:hypothetical protein
MHALAQQHLTFQDEWTVPESSVMEAYVQYGSRVYTFNSWPRIACKKKQHVFIRQTFCLYGCQHITRCEHVHEYMRMQQLNVVRVRHVCVYVIRYGSVKYAGM